MNKAKFVKEITVIDPDSKGEVEMEVYKHENGGMFAIDSSFLEETTEDGENPIIRDPFETTGNVMLIMDNQLSNFIESVDLPQD